MRSARIGVLVLAAWMSAGASPAWAWGCLGHQTVGIMAERLLGPSTMKAVAAVLAAGPVDPAIKPYCTPLPSNPLGDASTWADDYRAIDGTTAGWHFIDFPHALGTHVSSYKEYCPGGDCIIDAIVTQYHLLRTSTDPKVKANALRFVVHFVGDLHQPLHATTNGDRGGNCLPVTYFSEKPVEDDRHSFRPNLHGIWDENLVRRVMTMRGLNDPGAFADALLKSGKTHSVSAKEPTAPRVESWAKDSSKLALRVVYGKLPVTPPIEPAAAATLLSCDDNNHVGRRMAQLHETIGDAYADAAGRTIVTQMRLAGERLADVLRSVFP